MNSLWILNVRKITFLQLFLKNISGFVLVGMEGRDLGVFKGILGLCMPF